MEKTRQLKIYPLVSYEKKFLQPLGFLVFKFLAISGFDSIK
jgi:hypothetical protein